VRFIPFALLRIIQSACWLPSRCSPSLLRPFCLVLYWPKAAWRPRPKSVLPAHGGLCPRAAIKCGRMVRRPPPGSGCRLLKAARNPYPWKGVLGAGTDCILKPCCRSQELCIRFLQPLGRDPHGETSSHVAEKVQTAKRLPQATRGVSHMFRGIRLH